MYRPRTALSTLLMGLCSLIAVWRFAPPLTPPIFDGTCTTNPYRYFGHTQAGVPESMGASQTVAITGGRVDTIQVVADDVDSPQAQLLLLAGTAKVPASASSLTVAISPVTPPPTKPTDGIIDGNVYNFSITTNAGPPTSYSTPPTVVLRSTSTSGPKRVLEEFNGSSWKPLPTFVVGCADTIEALSPNLGEIAAVAQSGSSATSPTPASSSAANPNDQGSTASLAVVAAAVGVFLVTGGVIVLVRRSQNRKKPKRKA